MPGSKEYWLRGSAPTTDGWTRVYVPKTTGLPEESRTDDKDILVFIQRIKDNERTMKNAEKEMRKTGNYVGAVKLFDGMARLRRTEEQCQPQSSSRQWQCEQTQRQSDIKFNWHQC